MCARSGARGRITMGDVLCILSLRDSRIALGYIYGCLFFLFRCCGAVFANIVNSRYPSRSLIDNKEKYNNIIDIPFGSRKIVTKSSGSMIFHSPPKSTISLHPQLIGLVIPTSSLMNRRTSHIKYSPSSQLSLSLIKLLALKSASLSLFVADSSRLIPTSL